MTDFDHGCKSKGVMELSHLNSLCMYITDFLLDPNRRCAGKNKEIGFFSWICIQDACMKIQVQSWKPVPWYGTVTYTIEGVYGLVSQDRWDKSKRLILELV